MRHRMLLAEGKGWSMALALALAAWAGPSWAQEPAPAPEPPAAAAVAAPAAATEAATEAASEAAAAEAAAEVAAGSTVLPAEVTAPICEGRSPCRIAASQDAGVNAARAPMYVVSVALHDEDASAETAPRCLPEEHWLVVVPPGESPLLQPLVGTCAEGNLVEAVDEDVVTVVANRLSFVQRRGEQWRYTVERTIQLSPLQLVSETEERRLVGAESIWHSSFSWEAVAGRVEWYSPTCDTKGTPSAARPAAEAAAPSVAADPAARPALRYHYLPVPLVDAPADLIRDGWLTTSLGACALAIDSSGDQGFLLEGAVSAPEDASLRALLLSRRHLMVEVSDDMWRAGAKDPLQGDHLLLWLGPRAQPGAECHDPLGPPQLWRVTVADGRVIAPSPELEGQVSVRRQELVVRGGRTMVRVLVTLAEDVAGLTLGYADVDETGAVERRVASSQLRPADAASLGGTLNLSSKQVVCDLRRDALLPRITHGVDPKVPFLTMP